MNKLRSVKNVLLVDRGASFGGSLVVTARLAYCLDQQKYRPIVISAIDWNTIRHHIPESISAYRVTEPFNYVTWAKAVGILKKTIRPNFIFKFLVYCLSIIRSAANLSYLAKVISIIVKEKIEIVHVNNSIHAVIAAKLCRKKCIWHFHGYDKSGSKFDEITWAKCDKFISISHYITKMAIQDNIPPEKLVTVHNPTSPRHRWLSDQEKEDTRKGAGIDKHQVIVSIFGRLVSWKGQLEFLKGFKFAADKNHEIHALIVGDSADDADNYRELLTRFVAENNLSKRVTFAGYIMDVDSYYQVSDIVVHASVEPEPFGLVITEAMQNGVPVIGSIMGAAPELIDEGVNGFIVDPKNPKSIAEKILLLANNTDLRSAMAKNAIEKATREFSPTIYAERIQQIYDGIITEAR